MQFSDMYFASKRECVYVPEMERERAKVCVVLGVSLSTSHRWAEACAGTINQKTRKKE